MTVSKVIYRGAFARCPIYGSERVSSEKVDRELFNKKHGLINCMHLARTYETLYSNQNEIQKSMVCTHTCTRKRALYKTRFIECIPLHLELFCIALHH